MPGATTDNKRRPSVLLVDPEQAISAPLNQRLQAAGSTTQSVATLDLALAELDARSYDVVILEMPGDFQFDDGSIPKVLAISPWSLVVVICSAPTVEGAVRAMQLGAIDYLAKPVTLAEIRAFAQKIKILLGQLPGPPTATPDYSTSSSPTEFRTTSAQMRSALEAARRAADGTAPILIEGEAGSGKRTLAHAIHLWSLRSSKPFTITTGIASNAARLEADWFGSPTDRPGAANGNRPGRLAMTGGGTFLVEDLDRLPASTQRNFLELIEHEPHDPARESSSGRADARIIATTSADLDALVDAGKFDARLLQVMRTVSIEMPPLRRRVNDIPFLAECYRQFFSRKTGRRVTSLSTAAMHLLQHHSWPGNVRELRMLMERAVVMCRGTQIETPDFRLGALNRLNAVSIGDSIPLERIEELHIRSVLASAHSLEAAAATLGINSATLWRRRKKYGI